MRESVLSSAKTAAVASPKSSISATTKRAARKIFRRRLSLKSTRPERSNLNYELYINPNSINIKLIFSIVIILNAQFHSLSLNSFNRLVFARAQNFNFQCLNYYSKNHKRDAAKIIII